MIFNDKKDLIDALSAFFPFEFTLKPVVEIFTNEIFNYLPNPPTTTLLRAGSISNTTANTILSPSIISGHFTVIAFATLPVSLSISAIGSHPSVPLFRDNGYSSPIVNGSNFVTASAVTAQGNYLYLGSVPANDSVSYHCFIIPSGMTFSSTLAPSFQQSGSFTFTKPSGSISQPTSYNLSLSFRNLYGFVSSPSVSGANLFFTRLYNKRENNYQLLHTQPNFYNPVLFNSVCFNSTSLNNSMNFSGYEIVPAITQNTVIPQTTVNLLP